MGRPLVFLPLQMIRHLEWININQLWSNCETLHTGLHFGNPMKLQVWTVCFGKSKNNNEPGLNSSMVKEALEISGESRKYKGCFAQAFSSGDVFSSLWSSVTQCKCCRGLEWHYTCNVWMHRHFPKGRIKNGKKLETHMWLVTSNILTA